MTNDAIYSQNLGKLIAHAEIIRRMKADLDQQMNVALETLQIALRDTDIDLLAYDMTQLGATPETIAWIRGLAVAGEL